MSENFDFVNMTDYQADMRETAEQAAHVIGEIKKDRDFWKAAFWAAVKASGGRIRIPIDVSAGPLTVARPCDKGQEISHYQYDDTYEFRLTT